MGHTGARGAAAFQWANVAYFAMLFINTVLEMSYNCNYNFAKNYHHVKRPSAPTDEYSVLHGLLWVTTW